MKIQKTVQYKVKNTQEGQDFLKALQQCVESHGVSFSSYPDRSHEYYYAEYSISVEPSLQENLSLEPEESVVLPTSEEEKDVAEEKPEEKPEEEIAEEPEWKEGFVLNIMNRYYAGPKPHYPKSILMKEKAYAFVFDDASVVSEKCIQIMHAGYPIPSVEKVMANYVGEWQEGGEIAG